MMSSSSTGPSRLEAQQEAVLQEGAWGLGRRFQGSSGSRASAVHPSSPNSLASGPILISHGVREGWDWM